MKRSWPNVRHNPGFDLQGLRKTMENTSQDSRSLNRDLNAGPSKYEAPHENYDR